MTTARITGSRYAARIFAFASGPLLTGWGSLPGIQRAGERNPHRNLGNPPLLIVSDLDR